MSNRTGRDEFGMSQQDEEVGTQRCGRSQGVRSCANGPARVERV